MKALVPELPERIECTKEYFVNRMIPRKRSPKSGKAGRRSQNGLGATHSPGLDGLARYPLQNRCKALGLWEICKIVISLSAAMTSTQPATQGDDAQGHATKNEAVRKSDIISHYHARITQVTIFNDHETRSVLSTCNFPIIFQN